MTEQEMIELYGEDKVDRLMDTMHDTPVADLIEELIGYWTPEYVEEVMANYADDEENDDGQ
jgi:hypothetical protein